MAYDNFVGVHGCALRMLFGYTVIEAWYFCEGEATSDCCGDGVVRQNAGERGETLSKTTSTFLGFSGPKRT